MAEILKCKHCGKPLTGKRTVFCSDQCNKRHQQKLARKPQPPKECIICGKTFTPRNVFQLCCSKECSAKHKADLARKTTKRIMSERMRKAVAENAKLALQDSPVRICGRCGHEFILEPGQNPNRCPKCTEMDRQTVQNRKEQERLYGDPKPTHLCADCHKVKTFNHRCDKCLAKWRRKHGIRTDNCTIYEEEDAFHVVF